MSIADISNIYSFKQLIQQACLFRYIYFLFRYLFIYLDILYIYIDICLFLYCMSTKSCPLSIYQIYIYPFSYDNRNWRLQ